MPTHHFILFFMMVLSFSVLLFHGLGLGLGFSESVGVLAVCFLTMVRELLALHLTNFSLSECRSVFARSSLRRVS